MVQKLQPIIAWIGENWVLVALVLSETAALLPTKYSGIIQGTIRFLGKLFEKKK